MASYPTLTVKQQWLAALSALPALAGVQLGYSWAGDLTTAPEAIWFEGDRSSFEVHSLRAGTRRRLVTTEFLAVVQVLGVGRSQLQADTRCYELVSVLDEHIAAEEHLASPGLVDVAWFIAADLEQGPVDNGNGARIVCTIRYQSRPL